ncbi:unnamed protein product [Schistocephalus solidus]|uniref:PKD_channel domain-containing protein n=1 Tax=Schistocephalus solidus TaxID=70667 RepID=A0A183T829_SCHSO|nr:unnamed protein product [Schistocephalus solidus]
MLAALYVNGQETRENGDTEFHIGTDNKLVGRPRIRQVAVRSVECALPNSLKKQVRLCYPNFDAKFESTAKLEPKFGQNLTYSTRAWTWSSVEEVGSGRIDGDITSYPGSGYFIDLSTERNVTEAILEELFRGLWTTKATRAVIIDFTLYNANLNLFCIGRQNLIMFFICALIHRILFETPYTGGVISSAVFRPLRLLLGTGVTTKCVFTCEIITLAFVLYFVIEEILEIKHLGLAYFRKFWNLLDFTVVAFSLTCVILHCYGYIISFKLLGNGVTADAVYPEFVDIAYWCLQYNRMLALLVFFAMIKLFKFVSFSETMGQLTATLSYAIYDLTGFTVMFGIVFSAFVQAGYLMFGRSSFEFCTFSQTAFVLYRIILGDFDMEAIKAAHSTLGPLYFIIYIFFVFFVLLNMFLAIIGEAYSKVKDRMAKRTNDFKMMGYLRQARLF